MSAKGLKTATTPEEVKAALAEAKTLDAAALLALVEEVAVDAAKARADLRAATKAREVLLASVAHDLRNPLNTFAMSTGLLRDDLEHPDFERTRAVSLVTRMERASVRMQRLIEDLLEASRIEAGGLEINAKSEDAAAVVRAAIEKAKPIAADKGATVEEGVLEPDLTAPLDRARVVEALAKLVSLALKSTGEGGVVRIGVEKRDDKIAFSVRGLAPRATKSTLPEDGRGGLALLIARGILTAHGGTLVTETAHDGARNLAVFKSA